MSSSDTYLYHFAARRVSEGGVDELGDYYSTGYHIEVSLERFRIVKRTPKGFRLSNGMFVLDTEGKSVKRFAYPTIEEARRSFIIRKEKAILFKQREIADVQKALFLLHEGKYRNNWFGETKCP